MASDSDLIELLKQRILKEMALAPQCRTNQNGLRNVDIEKLCGFELHLGDHDHWLTYSLLHALIADGRVEKVGKPGKYRLRGS